VEGAVPYRAVGLAVLGCHLFSAVATARWLTRRHRFAVRNRAEQDQSKTRASKHHKLYPAFPTGPNLFTAHDCA
jgi:hypothetical protein